VSNSIREKPRRPVPEQQDDLPVGVRQARRDRRGSANAKAAERSGVDEVLGLVGGDVLAGAATPAASIGVVGREQATPAMMTGRSAPSMTRAAAATGGVGVLQSGLAVVAK
jgi:hypothetical protein